jgi:DNA-binding winged helix-turn-helix (wHTH) protein
LTPTGELRRGAEPISVEPQVFDLLIYLVENRDRVVSKDDLIASVWGGRVVSDSTLTSRINAARKAVGDSGGNQKLIRTIARKGLRFVGDVRVGPLGADPHDLMSRTHEDAQESSRPALPLPDRPAIAVLPFVNLSGDPEQEYFSDGISEDIIAAVSKRRFFVIARNSSFTFKASRPRNRSPRNSASLSSKSSVRKSGERVRITSSSTTSQPGRTSGPSATTAISPIAVQGEITKRSSLRSSLSSMPQKISVRRKPPETERGTS